MFTIEVIFKHNHRLTINSVTKKDTDDFKKLLDGPRFCESNYVFTFENRNRAYIAGSEVININIYEEGN